MFHLTSTNGESLKDIEVLPSNVATVMILFLHLLHMSVLIVKNDNSFLSKLNR